MLNPQDTPSIGLREDIILVTEIQELDHIGKGAYPASQMNSNIVSVNTFWSKRSQKKKKKQKHFQQICHYADDLFLKMIRPKGN